MKMLVPLVVTAAMFLLITPVLRIGFWLFDANESHDIVAWTNEVAENMVEPFRGMFMLEQSNLQEGLTWVVAATVYVIVAGALSTTLKKSGH
jgi:hypothetical protein